MSKAKKLLVLVGGAFLGITLLIFGFQEYRTSKKLQSDGKQAIGSVTDGHVQRGRRGRRSYYLKVSFQPEGGQIVEKEKRVSSDVYRDASKAGTVQVTYLPSEPTVCAYGPKVNTEWSSMAIGVVALVVAGFTGFSKSEEDSEQGTTSGAGVEKEMLADHSKYDDQQKAA
jgi:hypothetical protein